MEFWFRDDTQTSRYRAMTIAQCGDEPSPPLKPGKCVPRT